MRALQTLEPRSRGARTRALTLARFRSPGAAFAAALSIALAPILVIMGAGAASAAAPTVGLAASGPAEAIAGENVTYSLTATNSGGTDGYNLAFVVDVPVGLTFVSSGAGDPKIYDDATPPPTGTIPSGFERWVWEDVSDLPDSGSYSLSFVAFPEQPTPAGTGETSATDVFPVGSTVSIDAYAFLGGDPTLLPVFTGATGVGGALAITETGSDGPDTVDVDVIALDIVKTEPSPEAELLRGAHDQTTVYRIEITNTSEGDTDDATLVDWIPAGLEFLQCGTIDNSTVDREAGDVTVNEYLGAPDLTGTPLVATNCLTPEAVETVVATAGDATTYGVTEGETYTRVDWDLGTLAAGSTTVVRYPAAVPLYENTTTFDGASTPTPISLGQAANLDNNNGASTRHGDLATHEDGDTWVNRATIEGNYAGIVRTGAPRATTDADSETIYAMDLSVLKGITAGDTFDTDSTTTFELTLRASEYMVSSDIVLTDVFSNGLCPLVPADTPTTDNAGDISDCDSTGGAVTGVVSGADVVSVTANSDGTWDMVLRPTSGAFPDPDDFELDINDTHTITYTALNRGDYELADEYGPTTSGDGFGNTVEFDAVSDATAVLLPWFADTWNTWDDSGASMPTDFTTIDKRVLARGEVEQDLAPGVNPCTDGSTWVDDTAGDFRMGDTACFEITVTFPTTVDVRNPIITDFLPDGLTYEGFEVIAGSVGPTVPAELDAAAGRLQWELGTVGDGGDLYVTRGSTFTAHLWATVDAPSNGILLDKPQNLLKYRQQNVDGALFFLREEAAVEVLPEMQLVKGVEEVTDNGAVTSSTRSANSQSNADGTVFGSDRDGIQVREGEVVTYRIDLSTLPYEASNAEVWDALPAGITKADVSAVSHSGVAYDSGDAGYPATPAASVDGRTIIIWTGVDVAYDGGAGEARETLRYDVTVPALTGVNTTLDNDASIIQYQAGINSSSDPDAQTYYPEGSFDDSLTGSWNTEGAGTTDDSSIYLPVSSLSKSRTSPVDTNNSAGQAVKGETVEFDLTFTVPAYTSVFDVEVYDQVRNTANSTWIAPSASTDWVFDPTAVTVTHPGGTTAPGATAFSIGLDDWTIDTADGVLTFPAEYTNATGSAQDFTIHLEAYIDPDSSWTHSTSNNRPRDRAQATQTGQGTLSSNVTTYLVEPNPQIAKAADDDTVIAGQTVTYTLTASNTSGRPTSYDSQVIDCVPSELGSVTLQVPSQGSAAIVADVSCDGTRIVWDVGTLAADDSETLLYTAAVAPSAAGGATYQNDATITGYSLDDEVADRADYGDSTSETVTVIGGGITKDVDAPTATIGEERDYTIEVTLPADVNFYDLAITDDVPASMEVDASSVVIDCEASDTSDCSADLTGGGSALAASGTTIGWWFDDVASDPLVRTITVTYTATVLDQVGTTAGDEIDNDATMTWNLASVLSSAPADASYTGTDSQGPATATITIVEPDVEIDKQVNGGDTATVAPGETFTYTVELENTGGSTAYAITVVDTVPTGVVVTEASISDGGVLAGEDGTTGGGTITWTVTSLAAAGTTDFTYDAVLAPSTTLNGSSLTNVADITAYYSHDNSAGFDTDERRLYDGPTEDAVVTPEFPDPVVTKTPTGTVAYIGENHEFTIAVLNDGNSAAENGVVVDTLPADWDYVTGSATVDGNPLADPTIVGQVLTWSTLPDIAVDATITIVYEAVPDDAATWDATNTGSAYAHTNVAVVTVDDTSGSGSNLSGDYTDNDDADVFINVTDIAIDKAHVGDPTAGSSFSWTLTVTNDADADEAIGDIVITDTLPDDATYTGVTGTGWSGSEVSPGVVELTHDGPLAPGAALPIATVTVTLPDDVDASTDFTNNASVTSKTFELELDDNDDSDPASTVIVADVELAKTTLGTTWTAGESISWELVATNNGPSVARSDFTLTDTLPSELDWATVSASGTGWTCDPVTLAGVLECTWSGSALAVDASLPTLTVSGDIDADATGTIDNDAVVDHPTPDPDPDNNDDATSDPISTDADVALTKTTVTTDIPANGVGRYRIEIVNNGPSDALAVIVDDTLPAGLTYGGNITAATGDTWACVGAALDVDCTLTSNGGTLPDGASTWFEFDVDADASVVGAVLNTATVSSDTPDPDGTNNTDDSATAPVLTVLKTASKTKVQRGNKVVYSLVVQSTTYGQADEVTLTDPIHEKLRVDDIDIALSADATVPDWVGCTHTGADVKGYGGVVECELDGTLERGRSTPEILISVTVRPNTDPGDIENVATVEWEDPLEIVATVYSDVDDADIRVRLTDAELAATGPEQALQLLGSSALLLMIGTAILVFGHRTRPRGAHFLGRATYLR